MDIERAANAAYTAWTLTHTAPPSWDELADWQREKYRLIALSVVQVLAIDKQPVTLTPGEREVLSLRQRLAAKRMSERKSAERAGRDRPAPGARRAGRLGGKCEHDRGREANQALKAQSLCHADVLGEDTQSEMGLLPGDLPPVD